MKAKSKDENKSKMGGARKKPFPFRRGLRWLGLAGGLGVVLIVVLFIIVSQWPALGAEGADWLRGLIGDKAVAGLEMTFNQVQDRIQKWKYQMGLITPGVAWNTDQSPLETMTPSLFPTQTAIQTLAFNTPVIIPSTLTPLTISTPVPTFTPTPSVWNPAGVVPLGTAKGEGVWSPYIQNAAGETVAYRTFIQPDPGRPYTLVAVVAIDLTRTQLHFVLGMYEPALPNTPPRSGKMPKSDKAANLLLAAFNGGFKARHGQFGAMADGVLALPPREGLGTLVIYQNGEVRLGEWGTDIFMSPDIAAFRQNGPLVIQNGNINPRIYNNDPHDWGYTVNDVSPTVRSGLGLSPDNKTLYYFCGPSLSMEALAKSMQAVGVLNAIQLDINNYWVLFVTVHPSGTTLAPEALLPRLMVANIDRYLTQSSRDFFYLTSRMENTGTPTPGP